MNLLLTIALGIANLLPQAEDAFWRDSIPQEMKQSYTVYGEQYLGKAWTALPWTVFAENKITGNRVNYEGICFEKRRHLAALVMAEIVEGKGRFMNDIIDGIGSFCEETWWGIPAHYGKRIPLQEIQEVDLFNVETASLIVWTRYMLEKQLDAFSPDICQRIDREAEQRILKPAVANNYWWKTAGMNWNPWICSNWLACVLICEKDEARKAEAIAQIEKATHAFIDAYPEDGGCDEGPGYWDRAAASMFEVLRLLPENSRLARLTSSTSNTSLSRKIRAMAAYSYKTYIGHDYCVNFADAHENKAVQQVNIVYPFGHWLNDKTMREFGAYLGRTKQVLTQPAKLYDKSGNFPTLGRELFFLRNIRDFIAEKPQEPLIKDAWLPNLQIMTARRGGLFTAFKGGHNGESHNHNDVGSFLVYIDGEPLLIDPGVGEYTAKTFSNSRYEIWTMQSGYHNLPQINGIDQQDGKAFGAKVTSHQNGKLTLDIAGAYPKEAAVKSWKRTVTATKSGVSVTEDFELDAYKAPTRLMLMTTNRDALKHISYNANQLEAAIEDISNQLDPLLQDMWGKEMYRIVLTVKSAKTKQQIKYSIK
ncbi:heparinase II/III family protein [Xylanibacter ruminicola]|uniref:heparinase II/III domain-containing protein n=1 Tax=Xylanibacter ruminicola TaxID=839 RepID=UPI00055CBDA3|nr:heparinase II/III family protein [Xylanibacter ruminicola]